ncbi:anthranilate synthase component I [Virgibacillus pantothenticus]|uniref:Anthranilate synthase component 1 n=1 Tax=Virgibacillus pantothenticus TaxID=1473 RepID=A0A0L0QJS1_VIRPA|nr:anthranilate synthase component I [Virgibacillus pantothenticus]KNE18890.1 anthranilate synthase subunit I [Virgibacillus pantothenticus]MBU8565179.1 anthranilate synthase component I [Virgibacillus pantothenticus]MBU8601463.1 anthranilate synthase component I [Virgibacillus pantothenticus]MBU8633498.1 anthranilate synthase component I [Virgibacillus pantothenticus]MBU8643408.1 anthranilate synthase component I [Virgibacillus pantothenticus]
MQKTSKEAYRFVQLNGDTFTPIDIYLRLTGTKKFLLESTFKHQSKGKYSFIGCDPYEEIISFGEQTKIINCETGKVQTVNQNAITYLEQSFPQMEFDLPFPFYGGAVGYIGYDAIRLTEDIGERLPDPLDMPDIHLMVYQDVIVFDHANETIHLIAIQLPHEQNVDLDERLMKLKQYLVKPVKNQEQTKTSFSFKPEMTQEEFQHHVQIAKHHIQQGDIFQVVLSQRMKAKVSGDPFSFYRKLRNVNPSPYMFYIDFTDYCLLGASPESLLQTHGKTVITNPIAGTRPRGSTKTEDEKRKKELLQDKKEIAEHRMLVDLSRNDLGKVCEVGSITIPTYMTIEKYEYVMHIVSEVHGKLKETMTSFDALRSCLPAGTVSGAPKIRAMQIINSLEAHARSVYGGGIGFINFNHDLNMALAIRSLIIKETTAYLQTGAGIVFDSDPETEFKETLFKAKSLTEVHQ